MILTAGKIGRGERPLVRFAFITDSHYAPHIAPVPGDRHRYGDALVKMRCVVQGHLHEGAWRELGGIAYFTSPASVFDDVGVSEAHSLVEVFAPGAVRIRIFKENR